MMELFRNAGMGWADYKSGGKMAAFLLIALLYLWFTGKAKEVRVLAVYASVSAVCCILPLTAVPLMLYQTKFYDYEWIWSLVPLTSVTAYGLTVFLAEQWERKDDGGRPRAVAVTLLLLLALLLGGSLGGDAEGRARENAERKEAYAVAGMLSENYPGEEICLLAPKSILEYVREADGGIRLAYGRNLWDESLNAYAYDTYDGKVSDLYQWMDWVEQSAGVWMPEEDKAEMFDTLERRMEDAAAMGVNCILFPSGVPGELTQHMEAALGISARRFGDYIVFTLF